MTDPLIAAFDSFDRRIQPSYSQRCAAARRANVVSGLLTSQSSILECLLVGSFVRSTAIRRFSDVDILAVFKPTKTDQADSARLLELAADICQGVADDVTWDKNAVSLTYSRWPRVDIIPALLADQGPQGEPIFWIPGGSSHAWQLYSPGAQDRLVANRAQQLGARLKSAIRMIKWWSWTNGGPLRSSEIETLACNSFVYSIPNYPQAICILLDAASAKQESNDHLDDNSDRPTGRHGPVTARDAVEGARFLAHQALELGERSSFDQQRAGVLWRRLFGERFPHVVR